MPSFLNAENLTGLGWCLLNSLWQMGVLCLAYLLLTVTNRRFSAAARHNLALFFSGSGLAWFICSLFFRSGNQKQMFSVFPFSLDAATVTAWVGFLLPVLTRLYLLTLLVLTGRYLLGFYQLSRNRRRSGTCLSEPLQSFSDRLSEAMGMRKPVRVLLVHWADTAQTIGFFRPLVLLPVALVNRLSLEQAEAILLHELHHIRRNDYLINMGMTIFRGIFFFNPFAHFLFKTMAREREHACDDGVLQWNCPAPVYAEALYNLEKFRQIPSSPALAADGNNPRLLLERIRRLVGEPISWRNPFSPLLSLCLVAAFFLFAVNGFSHLQKVPPPPSQFPASIKTIVISLTGKAIAPAPVQRAEIRVKLHPVAQKQVASHAPKTKRPPVGSQRMLTPERPTLDFTAAEEENEMAAQSQYAHRNELRNYSNEKEPEPELPVSADMADLPYIPSASFVYVPMVDTLQPDLLQQNKLKALLVMGKIKTTELQGKLKDQISRSRKELQLLKTQSLRLWENRQKKPQPEWQKIRNSMQLKEAEIRQLRLEMQVLTGEVVTI